MDDNRVIGQSVKVRDRRKEDGRGSYNRHCLALLQRIECRYKRVLVEPNGRDLGDSTGQKIASLAYSQSLQGFREYGIRLQGGLDRQDEIAD